MHRVFLMLLFLLPSFAAAEPQYYRVVGVALDDTLNVRAEPRASSADIGDLLPDAVGVEVLGTDASGKWGQIIWYEGMGWVSMRYLQPDPYLEVAGTNLPAGLLCAGTEPFWSVTLSSTSGTYSDISGTTLTFNIAGARVAEGQARYPVQLGLSEAGGAGASLLIRPGYCSDAMSDRTYPWQVDLLLNAGGGGSYRVGCCNLPLEVGSY